MAFRKATLVSLLLIPALVYYALGLRFVVVVEELPVIAEPPHLASWALLGVWAVGFLLRGSKDLVELIRARSRAANLPVVEDKLAQRTDFWRQRINVAQRVIVRLGDSEQPWSFGMWRPLIVLPRSASRWPAAVQDAILVHELCHIRHNHWPWLVGGRLVAAVYWPISWVGTLTDELSDIFQQSSDARAIEFYSDREGYTRALAHIGQRIDPLPHETRHPPETLLGWSDSTSLEERSARVLETVNRDPCYDQVFWGLAQATLAVFLLTGTTLERIYIPDEPTFVPDENWYFSFGRTSRYEDVKDWASLPPSDRAPNTTPRTEEP